MKAKFISLTFLLMMVCGQSRGGAEELTDVEHLEKGDEVAREIVSLARESLWNVNDFSFGKVGEPAELAPGCVALTVLVKYDPEAQSFFEKLYMFSIKPEARLYGMAGLLVLDPEAKKRFLPEHIAEHGAEKVQFFVGCLGGETTFADKANELLEGGAGNYLLKVLP